MITAYIIALAILKGIVGEEIVFFLPMLVFWDTFFWGVVIYNLRDLWGQRR
jgi:hypothetical protein